MKPIFILILITLLTGQTIPVVAQKRSANFDINLGVLTLPEINLTPSDSTFSATLRQVNSNEFILELDTLTPIDNTSPHYDPTTRRLYLPKVTVGPESYQKIELELITPSTHSIQSPRFRLLNFEIDKSVTKNVLATVETQPVPATGDAADDPAIWIHPSDPARSTIIGTQKQGGLGVYDLAGQELQFLKDGNMNNVDLRYNFPLGNETIALVAASNRSNDSIAFYKVNPNSRELENVAVRTIFVGLQHTAYGLCMYHSRRTNKYYVFINDKSGAVEQWEVFENGKELVDAALVRNFKVDSQVEGCVADDVLGHFYLGEEKLGIWKFNAEPDGGNTKHLIDTVGNGGNLTAEIEGLTLYYANETEGYLIASNQGSDRFTVYNRADDNEYLGKFQIVANESQNVDSVSDTDGIDVVNVPLGEAFPQGLFVAQDGDNVDPDENQNFKLVPWEQIADVLNLKKETSYPLR